MDRNYPAHEGNIIQTNYYSIKILGFITDKILTIIVINKYKKLCIHNEIARTYIRVSIQKLDLNTDSIPLSEPKEVNQVL